MKYRKKPIVVDAFRFGVDNVPDWCVDEVLSSWYPVHDEQGREFFGVMIETLEGVMTAYSGDYIIKGVNDEIYPCKADIFEKTYERVDDDGK